MIDSNKRKINYLRVSVTDLCNLRCRYCMPEEGVCKSEHHKMLSHEQRLGIIRNLVDMGIDKVRLTGGEPLVKKGIVDFVKGLKAIEGIKEITMTSNGLLLKEFAKPLKEAGLDRINISLDTLDQDKFNHMTRGGDLNQVLEGIKAAKDVGLKPIKINCVLIGGFNDDEIIDFVEMTRNHAIEVRFIELMPIGQVATWSEENFVSKKIVLQKVPELVREELQETTSPATYYKIPGSVGRVGLIQPVSCNFCSNCNRLRMTADGKLKYCLHSDNELDLHPYLEDREYMKESIDNYIKEKPEKHRLSEGEYINRSMTSIGG